MKLSLGPLLACVAALSCSCGSANKQIGPTIVKLAADNCVQIARLYENAAVETVCATALDALPIIMDIIGQRAGASPVLVTGAELICVDSNGSTLCVTRAELTQRFDQLAARVRERTGR